MPALPVVLVLYRNDATEIRYSDGTRLEVSPCGSTFTHHECPQEGKHPVHGLKSVHQRTLFATSIYKQKILQAIDFRNRFAERPYINKDFLQQGDAVLLYSNIKEVGWPKTVEETSFEILPNGGVRLLSQDEFASLVLSSHSQDFTVCYLSKVSQEKKNTKLTKVTISKEQNQPQPQSVSNIPNVEDVEKAVVQTPRENTHAKQYESTPKGGGECFQSGNVTPPDQSHIDPIYMRITTPTKKKPVDDEKPIVTPYGKTAVFREYGLNLDGDSHEISAISKISSNDSFGQEVSDTFKQSVITGDVNSHRNDGSGNEKISSAVDAACESLPKLNDSNMRSGDPACRCYYTWVSRHMSCDQATSVWGHPLKLAKEILDKNRRGDITKGNLNHPQSAYMNVKNLPKKIKKEECVILTLPESLPLTCQAQHLHKWQKNVFFDLDRDVVEDLNANKNGKLSVLLIDGVIYRLLRMPSLNVVEIYPGDGSVIVSQGVSGQYFQHRIPSGDQIEEKMYSIKNLLHAPIASGARYSTTSLIKRGYRLLMQASQDDVHYTSDEVLCWKHQESKIVAPPSTTVLEECSVPGHGKFSAHTDGRVRILFDDRTSLDMKADFSSRINSCSKHSHMSDDGNQVSYQMAYNSNSLVNTSCGKLSGRCRLFLPNGQYMLVDVDHPGIYEKYINIAVEWISWVNSSPDQRKKFYQDLQNNLKNHMSVERELKKINCFNYILENLTLKETQVSEDCVAQPNYNGQQNPFHTYQPGSHIATRTYNNTKLVTSHHSVPGRPSAYVPSERQNVSHPSLYPSRPSSLIHNRDLSNQPCRSQLQTRAFNSGDAEGYLNVKKALLQTAQAIEDIDNILERKK